MGLGCTQTRHHQQAQRDGYKDAAAHGKNYGDRGLRFANPRYADFIFKLSELAEI